MIDGDAIVEIYVSEIAVLVHVIVGIVDVLVGFVINGVVVLNDNLIF